MSSTHAETPSRAAEETRPRRYGWGLGPAQGAAVVAGISFLLLGIGGFVPGVTKDLGSLAFAGPGSNALLLGVFQTSVLMNAVFILLGLAGLGAAGKSLPSTLYLFGAGSALFTLWLYGAASGNIDNFWNFLPTNSADEGLRFSLGLLLYLAGAATSQLAMKGTRYDEG